VKLTQLSKLLLDEIDRIRPKRVVLESLSELRLRDANRALDAGMRRSGTRGTANSVVDFSYNLLV
jgi:hypothetical protein